MATKPNTFVRTYRRQIDPDARPGEAYGYWLVVLGTLLSLSGVGIFLLGGTYPRGDSAYWAYRQVGIVLAAGGLPVVLLGMSFRLALQPAAAALGGLGTLVSAAAVTWFIALYPSEWTFAGPRPVMITYLAGVSLLVAGLTVIPMAATRIPSEQNARIPRQPYYELVDESDGWRWRLFDTDDIALAESSVRFASRTEARAAMDDLAVAAPVAGTEVAADEEA